MSVQWGQSSVEETTKRLGAGADGLASKDVSERLGRGVTVEAKRALDHLRSTA